MSLFSYAGLFSKGQDGRPYCTAIRIPMIQRDYAQGRDDAKATRIRSEFVRTLAAAVRGEGEAPLELDFVFGTVQGSVFAPLDGQQRLTTLFLLHWYLAMRCGGKDAAWLNFAYETRLSARTFCEKLRDVCKELRAVASPTAAPVTRADFDVKPLSKWIEGRSWFMPGWSKDPTIASMLVMLDALHKELESDDADAALARLVDDGGAPIGFHIKDLKDAGLGDDIYVRMNSRGKPLTEFEIFKARLGALLAQSHAGHAQKFTRAIDGCWLDVFWGLLACGDEVPKDGEIDAAMLRYFRFVADYTVWGEDDVNNEGDAIKPDPNRMDLESDADKCLRVFGTEASDARLNRLFHALDFWCGVKVDKWFAKVMVPATNDTVQGGAPIPLFDFQQSSQSPQSKSGANLFLACCMNYSPLRNNTKFPARFALLLHAILRGNSAKEDVSRSRLRIVRNLADWSSNEIRSERMSAITKQVNEIMDGSWPESQRGLNSIQLTHEEDKRALRAARADLSSTFEELEDHDLLRGRLVAFDLSSENLQRRAATFITSFDCDTDYDVLAAALLAADDYTNMRNQPRQFLPPKKAPLRWREVLTTTQSSIAKSLNCVLDCLADAEPVAKLRNAKLRKEVIEPFLEERERENRYDWRYHFVRHKAMRESNQGSYSADYAAEGRAVGYVVRNHYNRLKSKKDSDPYLAALRAALDAEDQKRALPEPADDGFAAQSLRLAPSGIALQSRAHGWHIYVPDCHQDNDALTKVLERHGALKLSETDVDNIDGASMAQTFELVIEPQPPKQNDPQDVGLIDSKDRIDIGRELVAELLQIDLQDAGSPNLSEANATLQG